MTTTPPNPTTRPHPAIDRPSPIDPGLYLANALRYITHDWWIDANHILHGPGGTMGPAIWSPLTPEAWKQGEIDPRTIIMHSMAGPRKTSAWDLFRYQNREDITGESHLILDGVDLVDGWAPVIQTVPFDVRADCNYRANPFAISWETQDRGSASLPVTPWSLPQLATIISVNTCLCVCYGVWCTAPADWDDSGIGYHSLYPEWSVYTGKTCPGAARIRQMDFIRAGVADMVAEFSRVSGWQCGTKP